MTPTDKNDETPRTDKLFDHIYAIESPVAERGPDPRSPNKWSYESILDLVAFARQLERELAECNIVCHDLLRVNRELREADSSTELSEVCNGLGGSQSGGQPVIGALSVQSAAFAADYQRKIERDAEKIKAFRDKLVELCDRIEWKGPAREENLAITVREARAIVALHDRIAAAVAFITDERLGDP